MRGMAVVVGLVLAGCLSDPGEVVSPVAYASPLGFRFDPPPGFQLLSTPGRLKSWAGEVDGHPFWIAIDASRDYFGMKASAMAGELAAHADLQPLEAADITTPNGLTPSVLFDVKPNGHRWQVLFYERAGYRLILIFDSPRPEWFAGTAALRASVLQQRLRFR